MFTHIPTSHEAHHKLEAITRFAPVHCCNLNIDDQELPSTSGTPTCLWIWRKVQCDEMRWDEMSPFTVVSDGGRLQETTIYSNKLRILRPSKGSWCKAIESSGLTYQSRSTPAKMTRIHLERKSPVDSHSINFPIASTKLTVRLMSMIIFPQSTCSCLPCSKLSP